MKRLRREEEGEYQPQQLSYEEWAKVSPSFAIVQQLVTQGRDEWPDTFELALELKTAVFTVPFLVLSFPTVPKMMVAIPPRVLQWGWISHSRYMLNLFKNAGRWLSPSNGCTFVGWHYPSGTLRNTAPPIPHYVIELRSENDVRNLNICLEWIERYHTTLHDAQADLDAVMAVVPAFTKRLHPDGDRSPLEERERVARKLTLAANMDQFGL